MKVLRAGVIYAAANVASAAVPFLLLPLLTRMLDPAEYGHVVAFALLVTLCTTVAGLNAHGALGVAWFKRPHDQMPAFTATALALAAASTASVAVIVASVLAAFPRLGSGISPLWGAVAAITAGSGVILQCRLVLWQSQHKPVMNAVLQFSASVLNVSISLVAVVLLGWGGEGRNGAIALAAFLMACLSIGLFVRSHEVRWAPEREQLTTLALFCLPLVLHTLAGVLLSTADRWMVSVNLGSHALGIYGAGAQLGMVMAILADAFVKAYAPWLYSKLASEAIEDKHCAVGAIYTAIPAFACLAAVCGALLIWASDALLGPQYRAAASVLPWFMLGGAFSGVYFCTSVLFFYSGRTGLLATATLSSAICGTLCTWFLVSTLGVQGAAIGYALTQALLGLVTSSVAFLTFDLPWRQPARALSVWGRSAFGPARHQPV
ncbi:MAG: oligosaccharide flippase family protein [Burkholderiales bacterium]|nr:oligosaccharide flippase family protein [Burkholderiales bacterium]